MDEEVRERAVPSDVMGELMDLRTFGLLSSPTLLIHICDKEELENTGTVYDLVCSLVETRDFGLVSLGVSSWFDCLSPWEAPPVFGKQRFGNGASGTLSEMLGVLEDYIKDGRTLHICGYSLAGLFSLWASTQTSVFSGVCAASPSLWFPSWLNYVSEHMVKASHVYLSLGDREGKTRNFVMATVDECMKKQYEILLRNGKNCFFELNPGNHFADSDLRTAKGMAWLLKTGSQR